MPEALPQTDALVMAANRPGRVDPLCAAGGVSHKCMLRINGQIMLERVVAALLDSGCCRHVHVSIDDRAVLSQGERLRNWLAEGRLSVAPAVGNLADSVIEWGAGASAGNWPLLITTGDNALHTPEIIRDFVTGGCALPCDVALGMTRETDVTPSIPDSGLNWHWLKDGGFSSCNLYLLRDHTALKAANVFRSGGQFGKKHRRILKAFGLMTFFLYKFKLTDGQSLVRRIGRNIGLRMEAVFLPYAYGPIDVDNPKSFALSERLLAEREAV